MRKCLTAFFAALLVAMVLPANGLADGISGTALACSDGSSVILALDSATLTSLTTSVAAINANLLDMTCGVSVADPLTVQSDSAHGEHDFGVGGVSFFASACFQGTVSFSGHSDAEQAYAGVNGTINENLNGICTGHFKASVYCVEVEGNTVDMVGNVQGSATGVFTGDQAIELYAVDNGPNQPEFFNTVARPPDYPCSNLAPGLLPVLTGNITVHDAAGA